MTEQELKGLFPNLSFDAESHTYTVNEKVLPSVSSLLKYFHEPFNEDWVSKGYSRKHGFVQDQVLQAWHGESKKSTDWGTHVHDFAESYARMIYGLEAIKFAPPVVTCKQGLGAVQFFNDLPDYIEVVACELQMYNEPLGYCGTCDILAYNHKEGYYVIMDWKTNERLDSKYEQKPLLHIPKSLGLLQDSWGKYTCQFSFYQILLEEVGINVGSRVLIHLREQEDKKLYKAHKTLDVTKDLRKWLLP